MGTQPSFIKNEKLITPSSFKFHFVIGRGGFGKVWKATYIKYKRTYAIKQMNKNKIHQKKCEASVKDELDILKRINHPFIANAYFAFQDIDNLYLVMDYIKGGDLRYAMYLNKKFSEEQIKFIVANIMLALDYIHTNGVVHRDLKPENLLIEDNGYIRLTDFGIAKIINNKSCNESSGTPGYMAPEVLFAKPHSFEVDYFALGVIIYELIYGVRPYNSTNRKDLRAMVLSTQIKISKQSIPHGYSIQCIDFMNCLLKRKPPERLGARGSYEVFNHPWVKYFPWQDLYKKIIEAPSAPKSPTVVPQDSKQDELIVQGMEVFDDVFDEYYYYHNEIDEFDVANTKIEKFKNPHEIMNEYYTDKGFCDVNEREEDEKIGEIKSMDVAKRRLDIMNEEEESNKYSNRNTKKMNTSMSNTIQTVSTFATITSNRRK